MVQAARSGKQNIIEGSKVSGTSKEMEMKLLGVPRASLEELLGDYCDFLRVRALPIWEKESRQARFVRRLGTKADLSYADYWEFVKPGRLSSREYCRLSNSPNGLPFGPANRPARAGFCSRGRAPRTYDSRQVNEGKRSDTSDT